MAGTNAIAAKQKIVALLQAAAGLAGVQVSYGWPGTRAERECIYGTRIRIDDEYLTFASTVNGGRIPRLETATITFIVQVRQPDSDYVAADTRAAELGSVLEDTLAANPTLDGTVLASAVSTGDLEPLLDDDGVASVLTYDISVRSELT